MAEPWVEQVAEKYGYLAECKKRGIKALLDVQSVRLNAIAQMSLNYSNLYDKKTFATGHSRDMQHVICASAVPIFVTHDGPLRKVLCRAATPGLEVLDIHELLARL